MNHSITLKLTVKIRYSWIGLFLVLVKVALLLL